MDKRAAFKSIAAEVKQGTLTFPTNVRVAMEVRQALDDPDCPLETAAKLVQAEPLLAARVVAMANSVAYNRSGREVTDVRTAVMRLGFRTIRSLAMALVTRQMAGGAGPQQVVAAQLWEHTAHVASLAHVIAQKFTHVDADTALFAGLIHEVGNFYLLSRSPDYPGMLEGDFSDWNGRIEADVGHAVLKALAVPEVVFDAIGQYWDGYLAIPPTSLGDTLLLAEELAPVVSPLQTRNRQGQTSAEENDIDITIGEDILSEILRESAEEVRSLTEALKF